MPKPNTRRLRAPQGVDAANFGERSFPVESDRTVEVPAEAVDSLISVGGFVEDDAEPASVPDGHVEAEHADGPASFTFRGESYATGVNGRVFVPLAAAPDLASHGFRLVEPVAAPPVGTTVAEPAA